MQGAATRLTKALVTLKTAVFRSTQTSSAPSSKPSNLTEESLVKEKIEDIIANCEFGKDKIDLGDNATLLDLLNRAVSTPKNFDSFNFEKLNIAFDEFIFIDPKELLCLSSETNIHVKTLELMQAVVIKTFNSQSKDVSGYLVHILQRLANSGCPKTKDGLLITTGNPNLDIKISKQVKDAEQETNTQTFKDTYLNTLDRFLPEDKKFIQHTISKIQSKPEVIKSNKDKSDKMHLKEVDSLLSILVENDLFCLNPSKPVLLSSSMQEKLNSVLARLECQLKDALGKKNADYKSILSAFKSDLQTILNNSISNAKKGTGVSLELVKDLKSKKLSAMKELAALLAVFLPNKDVWNAEFPNMKIDLSKPPEQAKGTSSKKTEPKKTETAYGRNFGSNESPPSSPRSVVVDLGSFFPIAQAASAKEQADEAREDMKQFTAKKEAERLAERDRRRELYNREVQQRRSGATEEREISLNPLSFFGDVAYRASRELYSIADQIGVGARTITIESLNKLLPARRSRPVTEDDLDELEEKQEKRNLKKMLQTSESVDARKLLYDEARFNQFSQGLKNIERDIKVLYSQEQTMSPGDIQREVGKILNKHSIHKEDTRLYENLLFLWQGKS